MCIITGVMVLSVVNNRPDLLYNAYLNVLAYNSSRIREPMTVLTVFICSGLQASIRVMLRRVLRNSTTPNIAATSPCVLV